MNGYVGNAMFVTYSCIYKDLRILFSSWAYEPAIPTSMLSLLHKPMETFQKSFNYNISMNYKGKVYFVYTLFT